MKTSNIILLAVFGSILIWVLAVSIVAKAKIKEIIDQNPEIIVQSKDDIKRESISLDIFHTIIVEGSGEIYVEQTDKYYLEQFIDDENIIEVKNDTIFLNITGQKCKLFVSDLNTVVTNENVQLILSDFKTDSIHVFTNDNSQLAVNNLTSFSLVVNAFDESIIKMNNVNTKGMKTEFFLKNFSELSIDDTEGMSLAVQKDSNALYIDD